MAPDSILSADISNDSKLNVALVYALDGNVDIFLGNGDATFQNQIVYSLGESPLVVTASAFKDHTKLDLEVIGNDGSNVEIFFNSCS